MKSVRTLRRNIVNAGRKLYGYPRINSESVYNMLSCAIALEIVWNEVAERGGKVSDFFSLFSETTKDRFDFDSAWMFAKSAHNQNYTEKSSVGYVEMSDRYCLNTNGFSYRKFENPCCF